MFCAVSKTPIDLEHKAVKLEAIKSPLKCYTRALRPDQGRKRNGKAGCHCISHDSEDHLDILGQLDLRRSQGPHRINAVRPARLTAPHDAQICIR